MSVKQISVFLENKPGGLLNMTQLLAENDIDMRAFSLAETSEFGIARILTENTIKAQTVLKDNGFVSSVTPVLAIAISDTPGGLNKVLTVLCGEGINVEYMYAFTGRRTGAYMVLRVNDEAKAVSLLRGAGIKQIEQEELESL